MNLRKLFPFLYPEPVIRPAPGRDINAAARSVLDMNKEQIELFAKRDPDIFRDLAAAYIAVLARKP